MSEVLQDVDLRHVCGTRPDAERPPASAPDADVSMLAPQLQSAFAALREGRLEPAERSLREFLQAHPADPNAHKMLAEILLRTGRDDGAEWMLARCLELAPDFVDARYLYATRLFAANKYSQTLVQLDALLKNDPHNIYYRSLKAVSLGQIGEYADALACHEGLVCDRPDMAALWASYATDLRAAGRNADSVAAFRKSIALNSGWGDTWWKLSSVKSFRFEATEIEAMQTQLGQPERSSEDRSRLHFALGKAFEDAAMYKESFDHYSTANAIQCAAGQHDADATTKEFTRLRSTLTPDFFAERAGFGCPASDPVFIVGLPRSGSTLIEQILASHPAIEGTMELSNIRALVGRLEGEYPELLCDLDSEILEAMGVEYLEDTRVYRRLGRSRFTDKMPENFVHIGLIHLILPNAKIIDARRHPLDCCVSNFKQHFKRPFSYSLTDLGRYYRDYVELMAHYDEVLPGKVQRVIYERLVEAPEEEVRRLLAFLELPFDQSCLRFYETDRAVWTASSEQVRRPIYTEGIGSWQTLAPWLEPLKRALGPVLDTYPDVPEVRA